MLFAERCHLNRGGVSFYSLSAFFFPVKKLRATRAMNAGRLYFYCMNRRLKTAIACLLTFVVHTASAQDMRWLKHQIATLCGNTMHGRGYVQKGAEKAARYLVRQFQEMGLQPGAGDSSYSQFYSFPVNTFPNEVYLRLNRKKEAVPGVEFLVDAGSPAFEAEKKKVKTVDLLKSKPVNDWAAIDAEHPVQLPGGEVYLLKHADSVKKLMAHPHDFADALPKGCYIVPIKGKMTWTVSTTQNRHGATVLYVQDSVLPRRVKKATINIQAKLLAESKQQNVIGLLPGTDVPDSFIVFTAHYDHLGMMGRDAIFPGASDNASGTAMLLYLARYFKDHPQRYTIAFIAFSGEEAGLLGSKHFVNNPTIPLDRIRFLTNLDIMGDASNGVTAVNATEYPEQFSLLQSINNRKGYLPEIRSRGKAANSDHYFFSQNGVPCFFLYSNGGKGYYHDVFDKANELSLTNVDKVAQLLVEFTGALQ